MPLTRSRQKAGNVLVLVLVIALNGLAASGAMSGDSIGVIANRYRSLFLPADYVFGIWSLIYLGLIATAIYQALPTAGAERAVQRLGIWWAVTGALNVAWISLFSFGQFALALLVMVIFLITLIAIGERVRGGTRRGRGRADPSPLAEQAFLIWPQDIYLAWISVALIANSFQFAQAVQWSGFGIAESTWAVTMMLVATLLGVTMAWRRQHVAALGALVLLGGMLATLAARAAAVTAFDPVVVLHLGLATGLALLVAGTARA